MSFVAKIKNVFGLQAVLNSLQTAIGNKADTTHGHAQNEITGLVNALAGKADASTVNTLASNLSECEQAVLILEERVTDLENAMAHIGVVGSTVIITEQSVADTVITGKILGFRVTIEPNRQIDQIITQTTQDCDNLVAAVYLHSLQDFDQISGKAYLGDEGGGGLPTAAYGFITSSKANTDVVFQTNFRSSPYENKEILVFFYRQDMQEFSIKAKQSTTGTSAIKADLITDDPQPPTQGENYYLAYASGTNEPYFKLRRII